MIRHIVMWKFLDHAEGKTKEENMALIRENLLRLTAIIPELKKMEIGCDVLYSEMSYDMALICDFDSLDDMQTYKVHPEHKKISSYVSLVRAARATVDYEI